MCKLFIFMCLWQNHAAEHTPKTRNCLNSARSADLHLPPRHDLSVPLDVVALLLDLFQQSLLAFNVLFSPLESRCQESFSASIQAGGRPSWLLAWPRV